MQTQIAELLAGGIDITADISADHVTQIGGVFHSCRLVQRTGYIGFDAAGRNHEPVTNSKYGRLTRLIGKFG